MATANFEKQENYKLFVNDETDGWDKEDYELTVEHFEKTKASNFEEALDTDILFETGSVDIILVDGYYSGIQLYVNEYRKLGACSRASVNIALEKIAYDMGFTELKVIGKFSNGETIYEEVTKG